MNEVEIAKKKREGKESEKVLDELLDLARETNKEVIPKWQLWTTLIVGIIISLCALVLLILTILNPANDFVLDFSFLFQ